MLKTEITLQDALLAVLYDNPDGVAGSVLDKSLMQMGISNAEINANLQTALQEHQSRGTIFQSVGNDCVWNLTQRCRLDLDKALPKASLRLQAADPPNLN